MKYIIHFLLLFVCACSNVGHEFDKIKEPIPDATIVYFYRPKGLLCMLISFEVNDGKKQIATMSNGSYYPYITQAGEKHFWVERESKREIVLKAENGKIYFIKTEFDPWDGIILNNVKFTQVSSFKEALLEMEECRLALD